jgi:hypothetical protein
MTEERLIEILKQVSNNDDYIILVDNAPARIEGDTIWVEGAYGESDSYYLSALKIHKVRPTYISISLDGSWYELEITKKMNIDEL